MTHVTEDRLVAYALDDADQMTRGEIETHVAACGECRESLAELRRVLEAASELGVPERPADYGAAVWARLEPRLSDRAGLTTSAKAMVVRRSVMRRRKPRLHVPTAVGSWRPWLAAAAVLLLTIGAFLMGRLSQPARAPVQVATGTTTASPAASIRERVVLAALSAHLDRTERGLVELVNADDRGTIDISAEQAWARDLLDANRLYRQSARGTASPALVSVLSELEPILLDIVHSPSRLSADEFQSLRSRIDDRSLVFKVRVTGADLRARQQALIHAGEKTS
jgi:anti-sigma factor RsiW